MISKWMLGATLFSLLLCIAAYAIERALRMTNRATRTPWAMALVLAVVWPLVAPLVLTSIPETESGIRLVTPMEEWSPATAIAAQLPATTTDWEQRAATLLFVAWALMSAVLLVRLIVAARMLSRVTREAKQVQVDGEPVLMTESLGPAVVGLWQPKVAVPEWFMQLDGSLREIVLRHEREHCKSRDPQLVWLASLSVALMPWNVGIWILSRRLRLALEIDCDARTLLRDADSKKYSRLLLLIAQRQSSYPLVTMLAESTSHLSRRIRAMQMTPLKKPVVRVVLCSAIAAGAIAVACSPRIASDLTGPNSGKPVSNIITKLEAERMGPGKVYYESQVEEPVTHAPGSIGPKYPAELKARGVEGTVLAMFVVNEEGAAETASLKILNAPQPEFEAAVREALPNMKFVAAEIGDRKVKQLVQQPFSFALAGPSKMAASNTLIAGEQIQLKPGSVPITSPITPLARKKADGPQTVNGPYYESQVEVPASLRSGPLHVEYPIDLKAKHVEGTVLAMFVVNEDGLVDMNTFRVLKPVDAAFDQSVRTALSKARFTAATVGGVAVKQVVQQPFTFNLSR